MEQQDSMPRSPGNIQADIPTTSSQSIESWDMDNTDTASEASEDSNDDADNDNEEGMDEASDDFILPNLKSAADFLTSGPPFSSYKANVRNFLDQRSKLGNMQTSCTLSFPIVEKLQYGIASLVVALLLVVVMCDATRIRLWYFLWKSNEFLNYSMVELSSAIFGTSQVRPSDNFGENVSSSSSISRLGKSSVDAFHSIRSLFLSSELPPHITRNLGSDGLAIAVTSLMMISSQNAKLLRLLQVDYPEVVSR